MSFSFSTDLPSYYVMPLLPPISLPPLPLPLPFSPLLPIPSLFLCHPPFSSTHRHFPSLRSCNSVRGATAGVQGRRGQRGEIGVGQWEWHVAAAAEPQWLRDIPKKQTNVTKNHVDINTKETKTLKTLTKSKAASSSLATVTKNQMMTRLTEKQHQRLASDQGHERDCPHRSLV